MAKPSLTPPGKEEEEEEEEEDDYLTMDFSNPQTSAKSSTHNPRQTLTQFHAQRAQHAETAGRPKSKRDLAIEADRARTTALATSLLDSPNTSGTNTPISKGLSMMTKLGYKPGTKLGAQGSTSGLKEPIGIERKSDRGGIGADAEKKRKVREAAEREMGEEKRRKVEVEDYRERVVREREEKRAEGLLEGARKVAMALAEEDEEQMDDDEEGEGVEGEESDTANGHTSNDVHNERESSDALPKDSSASSPHHHTRKHSPKSKSKPKTTLKSIPLLWRASVKSHELRDRDKRQRRDMLGSLSTLHQADNHNNDQIDISSSDDDQVPLQPLRAPSRTRATDLVDDADLDETDEELDEFEAQSGVEKLAAVVKYLRERWRYCFWCKYRYKDEAEMEEGCPGVAEEDHD